MLRGVALLGPASGSGPEEPSVQTLAALPRKEELPEDEQQLLQTLPKVLLHRRSGSAWKLLCGTTRCFCTVVAEFSMRFYVSALRFCLDQDPEEEVCTCFWSEHPEAISTMFVKSLARLTTAAIQPGTDLHDPDYLAKMWVWLLSEVPLPPPTCSLHLCARHGVSTLAIGAMPQIECLPVPHVPLGYLVQRLSLSSLLLLFRLALLERKVVLRSSSAFTLAACGEAITSLLLFPFRWQHSYMPVSPVKREYLQQKGPYVLGLHREVLDLGTAALTALPSSTTGGSCAFSVFDLDVGEVEMESAAARLPELPSSVQARLRAGISRLMANTGIDVGAACQTRLGEGDPTFDREVQKVFFHGVAPLVTDLRQFYMQPEDGSVAGCFDVHAYVHSREPEAQIFARALSQTVAFRELLQETMGLATGDSVLEKALVQEQLQPSLPVEGIPSAALGRAATDHPTDSFQSVPRSSFASCPPDLPEDMSSLTGQASLYRGQEGRGGAPPVDLQLSFAPEGPEAEESNGMAVASSRTHLATWQRATGLARDKGIEFQGQSAAAPCSSFVDAFVTAVKLQAQLVSESGQGRSCRSCSWAPKLLSAFATSEASARLPKHQREMLEHFLEGCAAGAGGGCTSAARSASAAAVVKQPVSMCNVLPSCFARGRELETVTQRLGELESDRELLAEFEEIEAVEMPVLNMLNRCLKTPRHPCLVAVDLLRRAFMCLQALQTEDMQREAVRHAGTEAGAKRVRFSRTATSISVAPSEESFPEHLSPLRGGRRPRRSATLASLSVSPSLSVSVSPSRSFGTRSPLAISPERTSERSRKQGRSSDPNVLSSTSHLSPTRPRVEAGEPSPLVAELRRRFGELQACQPAELTHEEKLAFWLNVLNASTLAWLCVVGARNLHSNLFPMHVWSSFLQRSMVNVGGQEFSLFEMEHTILRACSRAPKLGWFLQCQKGFKAGDPKAEMALAQPAPEVSFGIFYPFRFGCPPLRVFHAGLVCEQLLLNCGQYLVEALVVEDPPRRRVVLPPLLKYYAADFGSSSSNLVTFAQSTLEAMPEAIDRLSTYGAVSRRDEMLGCAAPALAVRLEQSREKGSFASLAASFSDFDWHLDVPKATCFGRRAEAPTCPVLEALLHYGGGGIQEIPCLSWTLKPVLKEVRVMPPPGRPGPDRPDLPRHRRYVAEG